MEKLEKLEFSILELGAEIFELRERLESYGQQQNQHDRLINSLKLVLEERGIINNEDLDLILDMNDQSKNKFEYDDSDMDDNIVTSKRGVH